MTTISQPKRTPEQEAEYLAEAIPDDLPSSAWMKTLIKRGFEAGYRRGQLDTARAALEGKTLL